MLWQAIRSTTTLDLDSGEGTRQPPTNPSLWPGGRLHRAKDAHGEEDRPTQEQFSKHMLAQPRGRIRLNLAHQRNEPEPVGCCERKHPAEQGDLSEQDLAIRRVEQSEKRAD